jgi:hypothetical protein
MKARVKLDMQPWDVHPYSEKGQEKRSGSLKENFSALFMP